MTDLKQQGALKWHVWENALRRKTIPWDLTRIHPQSSVIVLTKSDQYESQGIYIAVPSWKKKRNEMKIKWNIYIKKRVESKEVWNTIQARLRTAILNTLTGGQLHRGEWRHREKEKINRNGEWHCKLWGPTLAHGWWHIPEHVLLFAFVSQQISSE